MQLPRTGDIIAGRYELGGELGSGAFGIVYKARQIGLEEDVALKIVLPRLVADQSVVKRFEREVMLAKGLRHPNTVRVLDYAETDYGLPFYAMEFIDGVRLDDLVQQEGRLSPTRVRRITIQVLKSLREAHSQDIVHRDLKPQNIILADIVGEKDFVKVLDFGLAKALSGPKQIHATTGGVTLGTPNYMSPEQAMTKPLDGRSDLYTIGLVMSECLTGSPAVKGDTVFQVMAMHADPHPLEVHPVVDASGLGPIVRKVLEKDREDRFADAQAMIDALEALSNLSMSPITDMALDRTMPLEAPLLERRADTAAPTPHSEAAVRGRTFDTLIEEAPDGLDGMTKPIEDPHASIETVLQPIKGAVQAHLVAEAERKAEQQKSEANTVALEADELPKVEDERTAAVTQPKLANPRDGLTESVAAAESAAQRSRNIVRALLVTALVLAGLALVITLTR